MELVITPDQPGDVLASVRPLGGGYDRSLGTDRSRFEANVRTYLRSHEDHLAVQKLRRNRQIATTDLSELERIFLESAFGTEADVERATAEHGGLGLVVRSLTGLNHEAATVAFDRFQATRTMSANQLHFLRLLIDFLAKNGVVEVDHLYESPFSALAPGGPDDLFPGEVHEVVTVLRDVRATAIPTARAA